MDDGGLGGDLAHDADEPHLGDGIDADIGDGVALAAHVAGLRGHVEQHVATLREGVQLRIAQVAAHEEDARAFEVGGVRAAIGHHGVECRDACAEAHQRVAQPGAEEACAAGDQHALAAPIGRSHLADPLHPYCYSAARLRRGCAGGSAASGRGAALGSLRPRISSENPNSSSSWPDMTWAAASSRTPSSCGVTSP